MATTARSRSRSLLVMAMPMPPLAPVTNATLPFHRFTSAVVIVRRRCHGRHGVLGAADVRKPRVKNTWDVLTSSPRRNVFGGSSVAYTRVLAAAAAAGRLGSVRDGRSRFFLSARARTADRFNTKRFCLRFVFPYGGTTRDERYVAGFITRSGSSRDSVAGVLRGLGQVGGSRARRRLCVVSTVGHRRRVPPVSRSGGRVIT